MISFKKILGQIHLYLGLVSGIVVFVVSLTGCLYVFEEEARDVFQANYFYVENPQSTRQNLDQISGEVGRAFPKEKITQIRFKEASDAAFVYHTKNKKAISINPYTLQILGVRDLETDFFNFILDIHLHLKMGEVGEQIIKWNVLIFFVLCLSGLVLWWPKQQRFWRQAITIKWNAKSWKRLNWDLHSVLGFYGLSVLLIISLTGIFWVFDSAKWLVSKAVGEEITNTKAPKVPQPARRTVLRGASEVKSPFGGWGAFYDHARRRHPGATQTFISFPEKPDQPLRVLFRYPYAVVRKQNTLFFDLHTGALLREDLYKNYNAYDKVMRSNYDFHTGRIRILGLGSKIVYFLASLFAASLPITGTLIWWNKRKKKATHLTRQSYANY
jgi:uncharacterized iron-regulated membrane protein